MCNRFLQYLEKKFSCFGQDVNNDNSTDECTDGDDEDNSASQSENSSERESFKSYSDDDEESAGEDVVESTGRSENRDSSYEDCYSKTMGSASNSIRNVESLKSFNESSRKTSPEEKKTKYVSVKTSSKVRSVKMNQETQEKPSKSDKLKSKQTRQQSERNNVSCETATTKLPKEKFSKNSRSQSKGLLKAPNVIDNKTLKKKDDKKSAVGKDHEKTTVREKKSLKTIEEDNKFYLKSDGKVKDKLDRERKNTLNEKEKTEEIKQNKKHLETAGKESSKKPVSNNTTIVDSVRLHNKTVARKKLEPRMPKNGLKKSNISRAGTFSKRRRSLPGRSIPKYTSKSIQKKKNTK